MKHATQMGTRPITVQLDRETYERAALIADVAYGSLEVLVQVAVDELLERRVNEAVRRFEPPEPKKAKKRVRAHAHKAQKRVERKRLPAETVDSAREAILAQLEKSAKSGESDSGRLLVSVARTSRPVFRAAMRALIRHGFVTMTGKGRGARYRLLATAKQTEHDVPATAEGTNQGGLSDEDALKEMDQEIGPEVGGLLAPQSSPAEIAADKIEIALERAGVFGATKAEIVKQDHIEPALFKAGMARLLRDGRAERSGTGAGARYYAVAGKSKE